MLKQRIITALILIPLIVGFIFYAPPFYIALFAAVIVFAAAWEWCDMFDYSIIDKTAYLTLMGVIMIFALRISMMPLVAMTLMFWVIAIMMVITFRPSNQLVSSKAASAFIGLIMFVPFWLSIVMLATKPSILLMGLLLLVWSADIGAYFGGKKFGKHKLIVHVSPNKTWEGVVAGLILCMLIALGIYAVGSEHLSFSHQPIEINPLIIWLATAFAVFVLAVFGDLFESMIKRIQGVKDSGACLPGHGGMLDRIDSLLASTPLFVFILGA
jgi:phosphatidate cytidylyltransferase